MAACTTSRPTPPRSASPRRLHALITGHANEIDRRVVLTADAALRHRRPVADHRLPGRGPGRAGRRGAGHHPPRRRGAGAARRHRAHRYQRQGADPACRRQYRRGRSRAARQRTDAGQQPRGGFDRRRARQAARAAGVGRTACRRAHLAQSVEVGRLGRSGAFHHSASAGKAGRHADQRIVADRLPDPRTVPAEDLGIPAHHLRPLCPPGRAADDLFRQHRQICPRRRRRA